MRLLTFALCLCGAVNASLNPLAMGMKLQVGAARKSRSDETLYSVPLHVLRREAPSAASSSWVVTTYYANTHCSSSVATYAESTACMVLVNGQGQLNRPIDGTPYGSTQVTCVGGAVLWRE